MPIEFILVVGAFVALMAISAFYLGDENKKVKAFARVGLVLGGTGVFMTSMFFFSIFVAVLIVMLPIALFLAWWSELFGGLF